MDYVQLAADLARLAAAIIEAVGEDDTKRIDALLPERDRARIAQAAARARADAHY